MALRDKVRNTLRGATGKGKQRAGGAKGDPGMQARGKSEQTEADLRQAGEKAKDAFKRR